MATGRAGAAAGVERDRGWFAYVVFPLPPPPRRGLCFASAYEQVPSGDRARGEMIYSRFAKHALAIIYPGRFIADIRISIVTPVAKLRINPSPTVFLSYAV